MARCTLPGNTGPAWISTRMVREHPPEGFPEEPTTLRGPADVFQVGSALLADRPAESFVALLMNTRHALVGVVEVHRGTVDASLVHPREVFRAAILANASGVILIHNHPSGDPSPSPEDRAVTRQLAQAGRVVGIPVLDHVIIGNGKFVGLGSELLPSA
jgi:DNA repair protein RadC